MAIVVNPNEVILNSVRYPLVGKVRPTLASKQPEKTVIGDYDLESNPILSSWAQKDFSRGMLLEELFEGRADHLRKAYWIRGESRFPGEFTPPSLATQATNPSHTTPTVVNADMELDANWTDGATGTWTRVSDQAHGGTYSRKESVAVAGESMYQDMLGYIPGIEYTATAWVRCANAGGRMRISINDGVGTTNGTAIAADTAWYQCTVTRTLNIAATRLRIMLEVSTSANDAVWFDDVALTHTAIVVGTTTTWANFNNKLYASFGTLLTTLDNDGDEFTLLADMGATITALVAPINSTMLIYLGDATNYVYMSTSEVFVQTNVNDANLGIVWDGKAFKLDTDGNFWYTVTPNSATPTWTAGDANYGLDNLGSGAVNSLATYNDVSGDPIIYAGTTQGLFAFDFANGKWILTQLETATHATGGKGLAVWRSALYISSGLHIYEYIADAPAQISSVGLDTFDGLPNLRSGEVVAIIKGFPEIYALIDSTYEGATSYSSVMAYDGLGWRSIYEESAVNKNMYSGIVSSVVRQALWFSSTSGVYYITLQRQAQKPKRVTNFNYAASGILITSWFDNNMPNVDKTAVRVRIKTNDCSANETVTLKYRTNHTNTDYGTGWTTVGSAITSDGITTTTFGSDAGELFKDIQFRVELARGSTTTNAPIVEWIVLEYLATPTTIWGYQFTVNCTDNYAGKTPTQLVDAIRTATETGTLLAFSFRNDTGGTETYRVRVWDVSGETQTGETKEGHYNLEVVAP